MTDTHLTTGQIARLIGCSQRTVIRLIDEKILPGFKIPGSTHRRVAKPDWERFREANGIPVEAAK